MLCPYWWCLEHGYTCEHGAVISPFKLKLKLKLKLKRDRARPQP